jgi:hypothetical protein
MWKVRKKIMPVVNGALGTIKKLLDQNLQLLPGHLLAIVLQMITLMSAAHIIRKCWGKSLWSLVEIWTYQKTTT